MRVPRLLMLLAAAALLLAAPAAAQDEPILDRLTVRVWPEFDRPAALVFLIGQTAEGTPLPVELRFTLPRGVDLHAVAYIDSAGGTLLDAEHALNGDTLTLASPNGSFWIEFYDDALQSSGSQRSYTLSWNAPYAISTLSYEIQSPYGARDLRVEQSPVGLFVTDQYGLPNFIITQTGITAGSPLTLNFSYTRSERGLTVDYIEPGSGPAVSAPERGLATSAFLIIVGAIIAALAAVAGYFYSQRRAGQPSAPVPSGPPQIPAVADTTLSERELQVLKLVAEGLSNTEIGERLGISPKTAARHRENIMAKLDLHSRTELVKHAIRIGLIDLDTEG